MAIWDVIVEVTAPLLLCLSAYPLARKLLSKTGERRVADILCASFVLGLAVMMVIPYCVGLTLGFGFRATSIVIYGVFAVSFVLTLRTFASEFKSLLSKAKAYFSEREAFNVIFVLIIVAFLFKLGYYLSIKPLSMDSDVSTQYLPYAQTFFLSDSIPLQALGYVKYTLPLGISFLYANMYSVSGSIAAESFRLLPLAFSMVTIALIYIIARKLTSPLVAKLASMIYVLLPLQDHTLSYHAFYPDNAYLPLTLIVFYFIYRFSTTGEKKYCLVGGLALGLCVLLKAQTALVLCSVILAFLPLLRQKWLRVVVPFALPYAFVVFLSASGSSIFPSLSSYISLEGIALLTAPALIIALIVRAQHKVADPGKLGIQPIWGVGALFAAAAVALVWYARNIISVGTLFWQVSRSDANLQWAQNIITYMSYRTPMLAANAFLIMILLVLIVHPMVGSMWVVPNLLGVWRGALKTKLMSVHSWVMGFIMSYLLYAFSQTLFGDYSFTVNPRDILPVVPFFTIYMAVGVLFIGEYFWKNRAKEVALCVVGFLGFISLTQSQLIYYDGPSCFYGLFTQITRLSFAGWSVLVAGPPETSSSYWLAFGLVISLFIIIPLIGKKAIDASRKSEPNEKVADRPPRFVKHKRTATLIVAFTFVLMLLVAPIVAMTYEVGRGNIGDFQKNLENNAYPGLNSMIAPYLQDNTTKGDVVLTVGTFYTSLQYKLGATQVIDLSISDNLATLRNIVQNNDTAQIASQLYALNVRFFVLPNPANGTFTQVFMMWVRGQGQLMEFVQNSTYSTLRVDAGDWLLYEFTGKGGST